MIGVRDELTERIAEQLARDSGVSLEWSLNRSRDDLQGLRTAGVTEGHGVLIVMSRTLHLVEAALVAEPYAGQVVRAISDTVTADPAEWIAMKAEAEQLGVKITLEVDGEFQADFGALPPGPWRSLELECACRVQKGVPAESRIALVASTCLGFLLAGLRREEDLEVGSEPTAGLEGTARLVMETRYERDPANRLRCIKYFGARCWVCDFDFGRSFGALGAGYIVVHHTLPVSRMGANYRVDPLAELIPLCPNCHSMVHQTDPPIQPEDLRRHLGLPDKSPRPPVRVDHDWQITAVSEGI